MFGKSSGNDHNLPLNGSGPSSNGKGVTPTRRMIVRVLYFILAMALGALLFGNSKQAIMYPQTPLAGSLHQDHAGGRNPHSKIIKLTFAYGKGAIDPSGHKSGMQETRERVIDGHIAHAKRHGYRQYVQRVDLVGGIMTKPTTALQIVLEELQKPDELRAEWVVQHDADMVVMNQALPLETFLPPPDRTDVHLLATRDGNGFNTGCVYMRVSPLMVELLGGNLMYAEMPGRKAWNYAEQGMLGNLVRDVGKYNRSTVIVPKHWINAYPPGWEGGFTPGDWILHTVAWSKEKLPEWQAEGAKLLTENQVSAEASGLAKEVHDFWYKQ